VDADLGGIAVIRILAHSRDRGANTHPVTLRPVRPARAFRAALVPHPLSVTLTGREREIAILIAEGFTSKRISAALAISIKTVETHRRKLMRKLGTTSLALVVRYAVRSRSLP
jgi:DNA-binding CsgD family transcriptional regulator